MANAALAISMLPTAPQATILQRLQLDRDGNPLYDGRGGYDGADSYGASDECGGSHKRARTDFEQQFGFGEQAGPYDY